MPIRPRPGEEDDLPEQHEINVTPLIDVMLVLLIVFMVAAPLAILEVPVAAPSASTAPAGIRPELPPVLTVRRDLSLSLGGQAILPANLAAALDAETGGDREQTVFLLADRAIAYGDVMGVMSLVRSSGYAKVSLVALDAQQ